MCTTCKPIHTYKNIDTYEKLSTMRSQASLLVEEGSLEVISEFRQENHNYQESQYLCKECGKVHVLWLLSCLCGSGGEWREISVSQ